MTKSVNSLNNQTFDSSFFVQNDDVSSTTSNLDMQKSRAGGIITSGDAIGNLRYIGFDGASYTVGAQILGVTGGTIGAGRMPTDLLFATAPDSVTSATLRLTIGRAGNLTIAAPDSGVALTITAGGETITAGDLTMTAGNIDFPYTNAGATQGSIYAGGVTFMHNLGTGNTFLGTGAGNSTVTNASFFSTGIGSSSLASLTSGMDCVGVGSNSLLNMTTGTNSVALGVNALENLVSGANVIALGTGAGLSYTTNESNNIVIGNAGTILDANTIRIGTQGSGSAQQNLCFIAGITGVSVSNLALVSINTSTGQLGSTTGGSSFLNSLTGDTGTATPSSGSIQIKGGNNITTSAATSIVTVNVSGTTQHAVQIGNATNSLTSLAVGTTGQVLTGQTGADPIWASPAASSITITGDSGGGLTGSSFTFTGGSTGLTFAGAGSTETLGGTLAIANGGTNATSMATTDGVVYYDGTRLVTTAVGTATNVLTSNGAGMAPTFQAVSSGAFPWTVVTGGTQAIAVNNGYIANNAGQCVMTLPAVAAVGDRIRVSGMNNATGWQIAQNSGQTIHFGNVNTTTGATGTLTSSAIYDSVELVCNVANTDFIVLSSMGNITYV